jgi:hypothetical protein
MLQLNPDIWALIAQFIPLDALWSLRTVNSAFFQTAMDARYRKVSLFDRYMSDDERTGTLHYWAKLT